MTRIEALMTEMKEIKQERDLWKHRYKGMVQTLAESGSCPPNHTCGASINEDDKCDPCWQKFINKTGVEKF